MNVFSLLLRVLLCISLVANGASYAGASVRMQFEHAAPAAAASDDSMPPCHRHAGVTMREHGAHSMATTHMAPRDVTTAGKKRGDDCCRGKACRCACTQASCAMLVAFAVRAVARPSMQVPVLVVGYPQPRLPHLIRPPIG